MRIRDLKGTMWQNVRPTHAFWDGGGVSGQTLPEFFDIRNPSVHHVIRLCALFAGRTKDGNKTIKKEKE